jgi:cell division protein FtsQ
MEVYQSLISELDAGGQHLSDQVSEIDLSDPEDARVLMPEQGTDILAHLGSDHFLERFQRYKAHIAEWRQQYPKLTEVDLRYEQQVVLQMAGHTNVAQAKLESAASGTAPEIRKPDAGTPEVGHEEPKAAGPKHVETANTLHAHTAVKPTIAKFATRTKDTKAKTTRKKHVDPKHGVKKKTTKPKPHPSAPTAR